MVGESRRVVVVGCPSFRVWLFTKDRVCFLSKAREGADRGSLHLRSSKSTRKH